MVGRTGQGGVGENTRKGNKESVPESLPPGQHRATDTRLPRNPPTNSPQDVGGCQKGRPFATVVAGWSPGGATGGGMTARRAVGRASG